DARAPGERQRHRRAAGRPCGGGEGLLSGPGLASGPCRRGTPAVRFRRDAQLRAARRRAGGACLRRQPALVHPGRIARRRGKPGRASGVHDPCGDDAGGARQGRHLRRTAAPVDRHRGQRRPGRRRGGRAGRGRGGGAAAGRTGAGVSAVAGPGLRAAGRRPVAPPARRLALLGTGAVGSAFVARYHLLQARGLALPPVLWLANSRTVLKAGRDLDAAPALAASAPLRAGELQGWAEAEALREGDVLVDATASELVANWHPEWLARGVNVVTANKLGHGGLLARSQAICEAQARSGASYGDGATVGAG